MNRPLLPSSESSQRVKACERLGLKGSLILTSCRLFPGKLGSALAARALKRSLLTESGNFSPSCTSYSQNYSEISIRSEIATPEPSKLGTENEAENLENSAKQRVVPEGKAENPVTFIKPSTLSPVVNKMSPKTAMRCSSSATSNESSNKARRVTIIVSNASTSFESLLLTARRLRQHASECSNLRMPVTPLTVLLNDGAPVPVFQQREYSSAGSLPVIQAVFENPGYLACLPPALRGRSFVQPQIPLPILPSDSVQHINAPAQQKKTKAVPVALRLPIARIGAILRDAATVELEEIFRAAMCGDEERVSKAARNAAANVLGIGVLLPVGPGRANVFSKLGSVIDAAIQALRAHCEDMRLLGNSIIVRRLALHAEAAPLCRLLQNKAEMGLISPTGSIYPDENAKRVPLTQLATENSRKSHGDFTSRVLERILRGSRRKCAHNDSVEMLKSADCTEGKFVAEGSGASLVKSLSANSNFSSSCKDWQSVLSLGYQQPTAPIRRDASHAAVKRLTLALLEALIEIAACAASFEVFISTAVSKISNGGAFRDTELHTLLSAIGLPHSYMTIAILTKPDQTDIQKLSYNCAPRASRGPGIGVDQIKSYLHPSTILQSQQIESQSQISFTCTSASAGLLTPSSSCSKVPSSARSSLSNVETAFRQRVRRQTWGKTQQRSSLSMSVMTMKSELSQSKDSTWALARDETTEENSMKKKHSILRESLLKAIRAFKKKPEKNGLQSQPGSFQSSATLQTVGYENHQESSSNMACDSPMAVTSMATYMQNEHFRSMGLVYVEPRVTSVREPETEDIEQHNFTRYGKWIRFFIELEVPVRGNGHAIIKLWPLVRGRVGLYGAGWTRRVDVPDETATALKYKIGSLTTFRAGSTLQPISSWKGIENVMRVRADSGDVLMIHVGSVLHDLWRQVLRQALE